VLHDEQSEYLLGLHLDILEDESKLWSIQDGASPAIAKQFQPSQDETPNFGFTNSAIWVRFRVQDAAVKPTRWLLSVTNNIFNTQCATFSVDIYLSITRVTSGRADEKTIRRKWTMKVDQESSTLVYFGQFSSAFYCNRARLTTGKSHIR